MTFCFPAPALPVAVQLFLNGQQATRHTGSAEFSQCHYPSLCCRATSQVEVLLYLSPLHHRDFVASMAYNLNDTYRRFMRRNPSFKARVATVMQQQEP